MVGERQKRGITKYGREVDNGGPKVCANLSGVFHPSGTGNVISTNNRPIKVAAAAPT